MRYASVLLCLFLGNPLAWSQDLAAYDYFFPIRPGEQNFLSGTMGEIRSSHFHAGMDIKTGGVVGYPVFAAADGYVSRVKVSTVGYGIALYLAHPNGTTTVYGHLSELSGAIAEAVLKAQYEQQSYSVQLFPEKDEFPIVRGEMIAKGGNSGGSLGPHLHFEIRNAAQEALHPLDACFEEVIDDIRPTIKDLRLVPMRSDSRVEGSWDVYAAEGFVEKEPGHWQRKEPILALGEVGLELIGYDKLNGARNRCGIRSYSLRANGKLLYTMEMESLSFADSRMVLTHYNYAAKYETGTTYTRLYRAPGNKLPFIRTLGGSGLIDVPLGDTMQVEITATDNFDNTSRMSLTLVGASPKADWEATMAHSERRGSILHFTGSDSIAEVYHQGQLSLLEPAYIAGDYHYLLNLSQLLPDSIYAGREWICPEYLAMVPPAKRFSYSHENFDFVASPTSLFDTLYLQMHYEDLPEGEFFTVAEPGIPFKKSFSLVLRPQGNYNKGKTFAYQVTGKGLSFAGGEWQGNALSFKTREGGTYTLATDSLAPEIQAVSLSRNSLSFRIDDVMSGIKSYRATLNGRFLLFGHDPKTKKIYAIRENPDQTFQGELELVVYDNSGNRKFFKRTIN